MSSAAGCLPRQVRRPRTSTAAFAKGNNLFANSVLALDATTGERKWHYQTVHHDIWDYDNPAGADSRDARDGQHVRDAVVQLTKMGFTFVLDRDTGTPLFPGPRDAGAAIDCAGGRNVADATDPAQAAAARSAVADRSGPDEHHPRGARVRAQGVREVPSPARCSRRPRCRARSRCRVIWAERNGTARSFDPLLNVLYVNVNDAPTINRLRPVHDPSRRQRHRIAGSGWAVQIYDKTCVACHGAERQGASTA